MAQALIKAVDFTHPDPETDRIGAHKRGDIIAVMPDSHEWGSAEGPPKFEIVSVSDSWLTDANSYTGTLEESRAQVTPTSARKKYRLARRIQREKERKRLKRHRYSINLDSGNELIDHRRE